jgi:hypothetical protein
MTAREDLVRSRTPPDAAPSVISAVHAAICIPEHVIEQR